MKKTLSLFACLAIACFVMNAQNVDEIISKYFENMGGLEQLKALKSLKLSCTMSSPMGNLSMVIYQKAPNFSRTEVEFQGQKMIQAYDGKTAWAINPMMGSAEPQVLEGEMAKSIIDQSTFEDPFIDYASKGNTVTFEGEENVDGVECYKVKLVKAKDSTDESTQIYYFDKEYAMPVMITSTANGTEIDTYLSDYREVKNGLMMAHKIEVKAMGQTAQSITVDSIEIDPEFSDDLFKFPASD